MLLILALACSPDGLDKALDTATIDYDVPSSWTNMGCDVDGVYLLGEIEEQAGPPPWLIEAWIFDGDHWSPDLYEVQDKIIQVWWSFEPEWNGCGLWVQSLWG